MTVGQRTLRAVIGVPFATLMGGSDRLLQTLVERAASIGVEPTVVFFEDGPWRESVAALGVPAHVVEPGRFRHVASNARATAELARLFRRERPDVVFGWISRAHVTFAPAAVAAGLRGRLGWYQHTVPSGEFIERAATVLPARQVLVCSRAAGAAQSALRPHRAVSLARPGIDLPEPRPDGEIEELRRDLGIPAGRAIVGISGRLVRWKGQDRVLRAVAALAREGRDVHALIVGGSGHGLELDYEPELQALTDSLGIRDRVTFTGHVPDALAHTQLMDVAVNASETEPFGLVLLEAMALEVPVVAVRSGGPAEIVEHDSTGVLIDAPTPELLAGTVGALLDDPARRAALGSAGRAAVRERFTVEAWLEAVRAGFDRIAG